MTSLNFFPDLCLLKIFDRVPVCDLLKTVTLVNHRWHSLLPSACARRAHCPLILVKSKEFFELANDVDELDKKEKDCQLRKPDLARIDFEFLNYAIECGNISTEACERLTDLFPNLKLFHFIQLFVPLSQIEPLNAMLAKWKSSLVKLKIWFWSFEDDDEEKKQGPFYTLSRKEQFEGNSPHRFIFEALFDSINSLVSLKRLELSFDFGSPQRKIIFVQLPIVRQLEQLKYTGCRFYEKSDAAKSGFVVLPFESLKVYGEPSMALKEISINNIPCIENMKLYNRFSDEFANRFSDITFVWVINEFNIENYANFLRKCSALKSVRLNILRVSIAKIAAFLSHSSNLEKLKLTVDNRHAPQDDPEYFNFGRVDDQEYLPVLSSVKTLSIHTNFGSRAHLGHLHLHRVFPSVRVIQLDLCANICKECKKTKPKRGKKPALPLECIRKTLAHLKLCENLKKFLLCFSEFKDFEMFRSFTPQELFDEYGV